MIVITKRVSLDFLGEDYADSYLIVKAIPFKELSDLQVKAKKAAEANSLSFLEDEIKVRFLEGKIKQNGSLVDITADDLADLPIEIYTKVFEEITGAKPDPNSPTP